MDAVSTWPGMGVGKAPVSSIEMAASALNTACGRFLCWLDRSDYESFDPYDLWGTHYGLWSRRQYYAKDWPGLPLVAPIALIDLVFPSMRKLFVGKERFATADAQLILALLNLYQTSGEDKYLEKAAKLGNELEGYSIPGFRGPCWGYPFDWQNSRHEVWPKNTPYITCTPYCYEAYVRLFETTGDSRYLRLVEGIAEFVYRDLKDIPTGNDSAAGSYSPFDERRVVNATAYRAFVLCDAGHRFNRRDYLETSKRNLNFVLESQQDDGSWFYAMEGGASFIDNMHTCFNLKNLVKINRIDPSERVCGAIESGYDYYRRELIDRDGNPKPFSIKPRFQLSTLEMYDFAEGINLGVLLKDDIPGALELSRNLAGKVIADYQLADGHFVTRVFRGGIRHCFPFLRWPQAQMFHALTQLAKTFDS